MSTYKKLNKQDVFITTYTAHKTWAVTGSDFTSYGIQVIEATGSYLTSLRQLYYPTKVSNNIISHSFDYYPQTTLYFSQSRNLTDTVKILSIPRQLYGTHIHTDGSFTLEVASTAYVSSSYVETGYVEGSSGVIQILDDGEGNLYVSASNPRHYIGDIVYPHGVVVLTDDLYSPQQIESVTFKSSQPIFTHNYHCKVREFENNFTYNPSALTSSLKTVYDNEGNIFSTSASISDGKLNNNVTGSSFTPYITTVGLYNDANELIAVGKLNRPVPKPANTEMTIIVKIDI